MTTLQEQKKILLPFLQRASEIASAEPKVAYYCRLYAVSQAVELGTSTLVPDIKALLSTLLATLEHDKKSLDLGEGDAQYCENFALAVFGRADRADRGGSRTKATAMTFYAASIFMEILNQFRELSPEMAMKQRFAAWRAADLRKAISEGREPDPPPSADLPAVSEEDEAFLDELQSMPSVPQDRVGAVPDVANNRPPDEAQEDEAHVAPPNAPSADTPDIPPARMLPGVNTPRDAHDHGLDLPSPPSSPPIRSSSDRGPVWTPPPPRTFHVFQKVLYWPEGAKEPQRGTVAKVQPGPNGKEDQPTYFVALSGHIEECGAEALVPDLTTGDQILVHLPDGGTRYATLAEVDSSQWPPLYMVRTSDGKYSRTTIDRIEAVGTSPTSAITPLPDGPSSSSEPFTGTRADTQPPSATSSSPPYSPTKQQQQQPTPRPQQTHHDTLPPPPSHQAVLPTLRPPTLSARSPASGSSQRQNGVDGPVATAVPGFEPSLVAITEAQKLTKIAASALSFEDVRTAVKYLNDALRLLTRP